jgi:hypothetical protein
LDTGAVVIVENGVVVDSWGDLNKPFQSPCLDLHTWPAEGQPRNVLNVIIDSLFPNTQQGRVPIVAAERWKSPVALLPSDLLQSVGMSVGLVLGREPFVDGEAMHPIGSRARLAIALMLYTGCRRSDVITLGWQHIDNGTLVYTQRKTAARVALPVHPDLAQILAAVPRDNMTFVVTSGGKPFTASGFYNWFVDCARAAGLPPGCSPHGLRKAMFRRLAEAGCTPHQIGSTTGHRTLNEVQRYTEDANRASLAGDALARLRPKQKR